MSKTTTGIGKMTMRLFSTAMICSFAFALTACMSNRTDLAETGTVKVRIDDGPGSSVQYVTVYSDPDESETVIRGKVYGTGAPFYPRSGKHVHVKVMSPDGQVIASENPRLIWETRSKFRHATGSFTVRLAEPVPNDAVVDVVFHDAHNNASAGQAAT